ncbi:helix-turn-helix transcriptional regulator [Bradyrhizobium sp. Ce-3]|uniref:MmyB family transcriptional regulator n=1 Tax=Bradyrhizobium sp. Ce-3 TaxID=2913970 RepID=UPI001FBB0CC2
MWYQGGRKSSGELLRVWRDRRHLSQLELANRAEISTRHLCFVETGRAAPSRNMVLKLARVLDLPIQVRNELLLCAGFAPISETRSLDAPEMERIAVALRQILRAHEPYPAFVIDRRYDIVAANRSVGVLLSDVVSHLLEPKLNVVRVCLHPDGLAPTLRNYNVVRSRLLNRLRFDVERYGSASSAELLEEVESYPRPVLAESGFDAAIEIATSLRLSTRFGELAFLMILATFNTASDATPDELSIESFFPADANTAEIMRGYAVDDGPRLAFMS